MKVGSLVKEKEGARSYGVVLEVIQEQYTFIGGRLAPPSAMILWPSGEKRTYSVNFLEEIEND